MWPTFKSSQKQSFGPFHLVPTIIKIAIIIPYHVYIVSSLIMVKTMLFYLTKDRIPLRKVEIRHRL